MEDKKRKFVDDNLAMKHHMNREEYETIFDKTKWIPWEYSQIVGYVEINVKFSDLKAYYYVNAKKVSVNLQKRTMEYKGKLFDVSKLNRDNIVIRQDIRNFVSNLPKLRERFKNNYFDTRTLEKTLDSIDFTKVKSEQ